MKKLVVLILVVITSNISQGQILGRIMKIHAAVDPALWQGALQAVADAGARSASYIMVRLPLTVEPVFLEWLQRHRPSLAEKIENRLRSIRGGGLNHGQFHLRMRGTGIFAEQISALFQLNRKKAGLDTQLPPSRTDLFRPPRDSRGQGVCVLVISTCRQLRVDNVEALHDCDNCSSTRSD